MSAPPLLPLSGAKEMLKSADISLTAVKQEDLPALLAWINDREQVLANSPYRPVSEKQHQDWFAAMQQREDAVIFAIRLSASDALIGTCQLHSISRVHRSAELQIRLGEVAQRRKGYGTQAVSLLLDFAFKDLNLQRVYLHVFQNNLAAIRAYEKVGFITEGVLRRAAFINGKYVDVLVMGILAEEYVS